MTTLLVALALISALVSWRLFRYEKALIYISHYHGDSADAIEQAELAYKALH